MSSAPAQILARAATSQAGVSPCRPVAPAAAHPGRRILAGCPRPGWSGERGQPV
ncbi:hypothetical protein [Streptomyces sp. NBC_01803]|uniref:hypothetical protein n=1 Tax=Streptomyces sp. NBC_01803 TaxID=2975946 RepID=UPI002DD7EA14|nr:hypothetical protein [Streptomyces sp. NBC_01803]WSA43414.1 hypothetical protein OIE51_03910 [Streptomyces sp. NBC_01803]